MVYIIDSDVVFCGVVDRTFTYDADDVLIVSSKQLIRTDISSFHTYYFTINIVLIAIDQGFFSSANSI